MLDMVSHWVAEHVLHKEVQSHGCLSCGDCCASFGGHLHVSRCDLERWRREGREDLLRMVNHLGWIWVDPDTGRRLEDCPFLTRTGPQTRICAIHETKPDICRDYPTLAHGKHCLHGFFLSLPLIAAEVVEFLELVLLPTAGMA